MLTLLRHFAVMVKLCVIKLKLLTMETPISKNEQDKLTGLACKLVDWFEVDVTIKIFGKTIFTYHYPPKKN